MQLPNQQLRINLTELKTQLIKRLGPERSKQYFYYLNKLLSLKLSKIEFNKVCVGVLGRENVKLHNLLIRSILKNGCNAKVPPLPVASHDSQKSGDVLSSPLKARSAASTRLNAKLYSASHESTITNDIAVSENGVLTSHDTRKPVQHHQEVSGRADDGRDVLLPGPEILPLTKQSVGGFLSEDHSELSVVEHGKKSCAKSSLQAPIGVPLFSNCFPVARRALPSARIARYTKSYDIGVLLDSKTLRERMQQIAALEDLGGVSMECANILNGGLDLYLKRLIRMSIELVGTRNGCNQRENNTAKHQPYGNGVYGSAIHHNQLQNTRSDPERIVEQRSYKLISFLDFKVAMELNPQRLGEDWPVLHEKLSMHPFVE